MRRLCRLETTRFEDQSCCSGWRPDIEAKHLHTENCKTIGDPQAEASQSWGEACLKLGSSLLSHLLVSVSHSRESQVTSRRVGFPNSHTCHEGAWRFELRSWCCLHRSHYIVKVVPQKSPWMMLFASFRFFPMMCLFGFVVCCHVCLTPELCLYASCFRNQCFVWMLISQFHVFAMSVLRSELMIANSNLWFCIA